jgi:hypothetical protein
MDKPFDSTIREEEFLDICNHLRREDNSPEEIELVFQQIDQENCGKVTLAGLSAFAERITGKPFPHHRIRDIFRFLDVDHDGVISLQDFSQAIVSKPDALYLLDIPFPNTTSTDTERSEADGADTDETAVFSPLSPNLLPVAEPKTICGVEVNF